MLIAGRLGLAPKHQRFTSTQPAAGSTVQGLRLGVDVRDALCTTRPCRCLFRTHTDEQLLRRRELNGSDGRRGVGLAAGAKVTESMESAGSVKPWADTQADTQPVVSEVRHSQPPPFTARPTPSSSRRMKGQQAPSTSFGSDSTSHLPQRMLRGGCAGPLQPPGPAVGNPVSLHLWHPSEESDVGRCRMLAQEPTLRSRPVSAAPTATRRSTNMRTSRRDERRPASAKPGAPSRPHPHVLPRRASSTVGRRCSGGTLTAAAASLTSLPLSCWRLLASSPL